MHCLTTSDRICQVKSTMTAYVSSCLDVLVKNDEDFYAFIKYLQATKYPFIAISLLRNDKLIAQSMTKVEFVDMFRYDQREALQCLFHHPVNQSDVRLFMFRLEKSNITIEEVFDRHTLHPKCMMLKLIK